MSYKTVLEEGLTVIAGDDHDRSFPLARRFELIKQFAQQGINIVQTIVVAVFHDILFVRWVPKKRHREVYFAGLERRLDPGRQGIGKVAVLKVDVEKIRLFLVQSNPRPGAEQRGTIAHIE